MKIMMLLNAAYPPDVRVEKEAQTLADNGIMVDIVCNRRIGETPKEKKGNITIHRINNPANDQKIKHGLYDAIAAVNFIHPIFKRALDKLIPEFKPDVLHVHDLPLAKTGLRAGKKAKIPVVLDLHENFPDALDIWFKWKPLGLAKIKDQILFSYNRWFKHEAEVTKEADHIIAVVDEMKSHLISKHGIPENRITVITNTERKSFGDIDFEDLSELKEKYRNDYVISYIGGMGPHRGIDTVLEGMPRIIHKIPNVKLLLVGSASSGVLPKLREMVRTLGIENYVEFVGSVPFRQVSSYMKLSDINLVPHNSNNHTENTIPHKLFQIMLLGCNLLVSSCKPLARIVTQAQSGYIFEADDATSFANQVILMHSQPDKVSECAQNGYDATMNGTMNWEHTGQLLVDFYREHYN